MTEPVSDLLHFNRRHIIRNILLVFSGSSVSQLLTALCLLFTARQLGPQQYGQYASSIVIASFAAILFSLGMDMWLLRESGHHPTQRDRLAGSVLGIKIILGGFWCALFFIIAGQFQSSSFTTELLRLAALVIWLDSIFTTFQVLFKSALKNQYTSFLVISSDLAWLLSTILLITRGEQDVEVFMQVRIVILLGSLLVSGAFSWANFRPRLHLSTVQRIFHDFLPYAASELLIMALLRVDILIISLTLGEEAVGLYAPAMSLVNAAFLVPVALHSVMLPVLSNMFHHDATRAWKMSNYLVLVQVLIGVILTMGTWLLSPILLPLLGENYAASIEILQILSINLFFHAISTAYITILVATNQQAKRAIIQTIAVITNIGLNLAIVYQAGIRGVAYVYVITEAILSVGYFLQLQIYRRKSSDKL